MFVNSIYDIPKKHSTVTALAIVVPLLVSVPVVHAGVCGSINPKLGYMADGYGGSWASLHRDGRNSDFADCEVMTKYRLAWTASYEPHLVLNKPTIGPNNIAWVGAMPTDSQLPNPIFLHGFDLRFGQRIVSLGRKQGLNITAVFGQPLIDTKGNIYFGQETARPADTSCRFDGEDPSNGALCGRLFSVDPTGNFRWQVDIDGVSFGGQWTSDGKLLYQTWRGTTYIVDPDPAVPKAQRILFAVNSFPQSAATLPDMPPFDGCLSHGQGDSCIIANTPAVHPETGHIYNTVQGFVKGGTNSFIQRWLYDPATHQVSLDSAWDIDVPLVGGSATSPDIHFDGKVLFANDAANGVYVLNAETGHLLAQTDIPYTPGGSLITAPRLSPSGDVVGAYLTFNAPLSDKVNGWVSIVRFEPAIQNGNARLEVVRVFDSASDPHGVGWAVAGSAVGAITNKGDMVTSVRFVVPATKVCQSDCFRNGQLFLLIIDPDTATIVSKNYAPNLPSSSALVVGNDGAIIGAHHGSLLISRYRPMQ